MSTESQKNLLLYYGPPIAIVSFLVAFWASGMGRPSENVSAKVRSDEVVAAADPGTEQPAESIDPAITAARDRFADKRRQSEPPTPTPISADGKYPSILVEEASYDFGTVYEGDEVQHAYAVKNTGDADLVLTKVKTSCGCTVAEYTEEPIPPGGEGVVDIVFKTRSKKGSQKKSIFVHTNDPRTPQQKLFIQGHVQPEFWIEPRDRIDLGVIERGETIEPQVVTVKWLADLDVDITGIVIRNDAISVEQEPWEDGEHKGAKLTVKVDDVAALLRAGQVSRVNESIQIQTDNPKFARQFLFVSGRIKREVLVKPHAITFGVAKPGENAERRLQVLGEDGFQLTEPQLECGLEYVDFTTKELPNGGGYEIVATLRVDDAPQGTFFRDQLKIRTNSTDVPELDVLVSGRVGAPKTAESSNGVENTGVKNTE